MTWFLRGVLILFVTECHRVFTATHTTDQCSGSWVVGGSLIGNGHVVIGDVQGAERRDIGKTLDVTVRGGTAYTRGLGLPIGLTAGGFIGAVGLGWLTAKTWSPVVRTLNPPIATSRPT